MDLVDWAWWNDYPFHSIMWETGQTVCLLRSSGRVYLLPVQYRLTK